jgi:hypothetical protein
MLRLRQKGRKLRARHRKFNAYEFTSETIPIDDLDALVYIMIVSKYQFRVFRPIRALSEGDSRYL